MNQDQPSELDEADINGAPESQDQPSELDETGINGAPESQDQPSELDETGINGAPESQDQPSELDETGINGAPESQDQPSELDETGINGAPESQDQPSELDETGINGAPESQDQPSELDETGINGAPESQDQPSELDEADINGAPESILPSDNEDEYFPEPEEKTSSSSTSYQTSEEQDRSMWSWYNHYQNQDDYRDYFKPTYYSHPLSKTQYSYPENSDKVIMPVSALDSLVHLSIDYPMLFQIKNYSTGKSSHCGVLEFTAEEGSVLLPDWMMRNLDLQDGDLVNMKNVSLQKATFLKLRPHKMEFITAVGDPKAVLESTLTSFSCLSSGDTICINLGNRSYYLDILETKPCDAVSINETDCEVDFAMPSNYREKPKVEQTADIVEGTSEAFESKLVLNKRTGRVVFGSSDQAQDEAHTKLRKLSKENVEVEKFKPFTGKKCTLLD